MATEPTASVAKIREANGNAYNATTNPYGLAQGGHRQVFVPLLNAVVDIGEWAADLAEEAANSATAALASQGAAAGSASAAATARDKASQWADKAEDSPVETGRFSALHHERKAEDFAQIAAQKATDAAASAAGVNLPAVTSADAGKALLVKPDGSGYAPGYVASTQIGSTTTISSPVAAVTFTGLELSDAILDIRNISHNSGSNATINLALSSDNGATWIDLGSLAGIAAFAATGTLSFPTDLFGLSAGCVTVASRVVGATLPAVSAFSASATAFAQYVGSPINAIRISASAGQLDAGTIKLFGRR